MPITIFSTKKTHFRLQVWIAAVVLNLGSAGIIEASTLTVTKTADNDSITPGLVLGSVSAVGSVALRSVPVEQEGTLFGGDTVRVYANAYAKIGFIEGQKVELGEWTQLTVNRTRQGIELNMKSGILGFAALKVAPITLNVETFQIVAAEGSAGTVAYVDDELISVRALQGHVEIRSVNDDSEFYLLRSGEERFLTRKKTVDRGKMPAETGGWVALTSMVAAAVNAQLARGLRPQEAIAEAPASTRQTGAVKSTVQPITIVSSLSKAKQVLENLQVPATDRSRARDHATPKGVAHKTITPPPFASPSAP